MEISGINHEIIEKSKNIQELALKTFESQGIMIEASDIARVSKRIFNIKQKNDSEYKKGILNVVFKSFEKKIEVMKQKRQTQKKDDKIFFQIALTPYNRHFMLQAKDITRGKLKVYFGKGCVRVVKHDKTEIIIDDPGKLEDLKSYMLTEKTSN